MPIRRADDSTYSLLSNGSATGAAVSIKGGEYLLQVEGSPVGATISLQLKTLNGTWSPVLIFAGSAVSFTVLPNSQTGIALPAGDVRIALTGGSPTGVYASLIGLG